VVAPPSAGLRADRPVTFAEAAAHPLVMPASGHALRALIESAAARAGIRVEAAVQTNAMPVQKQLARAGHGWTVLPGVGIAADVAAGTLSAAPLCEPEVWRSVVLGMHRTGRTPPAVDVVARELIRQIGSAVREGRWPSARQPGSEGPAGVDK
jgi:LysR family nitrogen assimilation transcriptional regulator